MGFWTFFLSCCLGVVACYATQIPEVGVIVSVSIVGGIIVSTMNDTTKKQSACVTTYRTDQLKRLNLCLLLQVTKQRFSLSPLLAMQTMNLRRFLSRLNSNSRGVIWEKDYRYYSRNNYTNCWHSVWKLEFVGIGLSDSIKQSASSFCGRNPVLFSRANVGAASVDKKMRLVLK